jgi:hypothetical protein
MEEVGVRPVVVMIMIMNYVNMRVGGGNDIELQYTIMHCF